MTKGKLLTSLLTSAAVLTTVAIAGGQQQAKAATNHSATVSYADGATTIWTSPEAGQQVKGYATKGQNLEFIGSKKVYSETWYETKDHGWVPEKYLGTSTVNQLKPLTDGQANNVKVNVNTTATNTNNNNQDVKAQNTQAQPVVAVNNNTNDQKKNDNNNITTDVKVTDLKKSADDQKKDTQDPASDLKKNDDAAQKLAAAQAQAAQQKQQAEAQAKADQQKKQADAQAAAQQAAAQQADQQKQQAATQAQVTTQQAQQPAVQPQTVSYSAQAQQQSQPQQQNVTAQAQPQAKHVSGSNGASGYPYGQCTSYVKGVAPWVGGYWGNGADWANSARAEGFRVDNQPQSGSVISFAGGQSVGNWRADSQYGHVAYVTGYNPNTNQVTINQGGMGFSNPTGPNTQTLNNAGGYTYIHN